MKNMKKYIGVALCVAMAMTVMPVSGSFVRPAIVKADTSVIEDTITGTVSHENQKTYVTLVDTATNLNNYNAYLWGKESDNPGVDTITETVGLNEKKIEFTDITKTRLFFKGTDNSTIKYLDFLPATDLAQIDASADKTKFTNMTTDYQYREKTTANSEEWKEGTVDGLPEGLDEGTAKTYEVRKKGTERHFPSAPFPEKGIRLIKKKAIEKNDLQKLMYSVKMRKLTVKDNANPIVNEFNSNMILIQIEGSDAEKLDFNKAYDLTSGKAVKIFVGTDSDKAYAENKGYSITVANHEAETLKLLDKIVRSGKKLVGFGENADAWSKFAWRKMDGVYTPVTDKEVTINESVHVDVILRGTPFESNNKTLGDGAEIKLCSDAKGFSFKTNSNDEELAAQQAATEEAKKAAEEAKKKDESKKEETKKEETKKEETKSETSKKEEPKAEENKEIPFTETAKPVAKTVKETKKTVANASTKSVQAVLDGKMGSKLTIAVKSASVILPKTVLEAVFGGVAENVKVDVKTMAPKKSSKDAKLVSKNLKKNKLVSKTVYNLMVKVGSDSLNDYDLQGGKFTVALKTNLKKAPKNLYVMNIANGKLMKAGFKKGMVTFKAGMTGKFVVVSK